MMLKYVLPLMAAAALGFAIYFVVHANATPVVTEPPKMPAVKAPGAVLAGSGIVEPVTQNMLVGSALPGVVTWVIDTREIGKVLREGTVLFRLDDRNLKAELEVKKAMLAAAKASLTRLENMPRPEEVKPLEANLKMIEAGLIEATFLLDAADKQIEQKAISKADWGKFKSTYHTAMAQKAKAVGDLNLLKAGAWKPDLDIARAAVIQSQAQIEQTKIELERLVVKTLIPSTLLQINVRVGEFVGAQAGTGLVVLGNLKYLYCRVDIDEHDASRFKPGMAAIGYLRGQADVSLPMEFVRVEPFLVPRKSLTGDNTERVDTRVLQVIYKISDSGNLQVPLHVGRQLDVFIGDLKTPAEKKAPADQP